MSDQVESRNTAMKNAGEPGSKKARSKKKAPNQGKTSDPKPPAEERYKAASKQTPAQNHASEQEETPITKSKPARKQKLHKQGRIKSSTQSQPTVETPRASLGQDQGQNREHTQQPRPGASQDSRSKQKRKPKQTESVPLVQDPWSIDAASFLHWRVNRNLNAERIYLEFCPHDDSGSSVKEQPSTTMGSFDCVNRKCRSRGWSSKAIPILIRLYPEGQYNVRVYYQRCEKCNELGRLRLDDSAYIEKVVRWLKIWHGIWVEPKPYLGDSKGPHLSALCEGCRNECCRQMRQTTSARSGGVAQGEGAVGGQRPPSTWVGIFRVSEVSRAPKSPDLTPSGRTGTDDSEVHPST